MHIPVCRVTSLTRSTLDSMQDSFGCPLRSRITDPTVPLITVVCHGEQFDRFLYPRGLPCSPPFAEGHGFTALARPDRDAGSAGAVLRRSPRAMIARPTSPVWNAAVAPPGVDAESDVSLEPVPEASGWDRVGSSRPLKTGWRPDISSVRGCVKEVLAVPATLFWCGRTAAVNRPVILRAAGRSCRRRVVPDVLAAARQALRPGNARPLTECLSCHECGRGSGR